LGATGNAFANLYVDNIVGFQAVTEPPLYQVTTPGSERLGINTTGGPDIGFSLDIAGHMQISGDIKIKTAWGSNLGTAAKPFNTLFCYQLAGFYTSGIWLNPLYQDKGIEFVTDNFAAIGTITKKAKKIWTHKLWVNDIENSINITGSVIINGDCRINDNLDVIGNVESDLVPDNAYDLGKNNDRWQNAYIVGLYVDTILTIQDGGHITPDTHKISDVGQSGDAFDDMYADDFNNVADIYYLDEILDKDGDRLLVDDLQVLTGIKPSNEFDKRTGFALIDDTTLPEWLLIRDKHNGNIVYDPDGKPYVSLKTLISLSWGAIRQLAERIDVLEH